ncbi:gamma-glutamyltransferase [Alkalihalobacillus sp. MEB130]|uniref:gamma-glutamyltransferase n=1 Tax=Alkalihalobacillus sp. MEB130 TaxID=2976704 RepID=UPI0028DD77D4|nr:gamma-glutamyltransferase [Alkalihalobacillus sp. MEB130]MDT8860938.1 gamma-glutamyltransferase [Alkalihalobacillus sp. MEB130]
MNQNPHTYPYPSSRNVIYGKKGMVATSQPLAAEAGLDILKKGGNAIDAAIATAACLTVVEPTSNGIGSDCFALVWVDGKLHGLNGSGQAPSKLTMEAVKEAGYEKELPKFGMIPVTVPGTPGAWAELSQKFGKLPLSEVLEPAIKYAEEGFPLTPTLAKYWERAYKAYSRLLEGDEFTSWFETFAPGGKVPKAGELWTSPGHAYSLRLIGETNAKAFYEGELADKIDQFFQKHGGFLRKEDLEAYKPEWVTPISVNYRGYDVWEIPPNGQGLIALEALNILKGFEFAEKESVDTYHKQMEAIKLAFVDGMKYIADPSSMSVTVEQLLSDEYAQSRRNEIGEDALTPEPGTPQKGGTVYLATADGDGNMVSFIQSNYMGFGSGIVVPETGIAMQNRGHNFSLDPSHDNALKPGKKTYHTIIPGFLTKGDQAVGPFGVMGGFMQPQGHVQVVVNTVDFGLNPQAALDAPRWMWSEGKKIHVERHLAPHIAEELARKGHDVKVELEGGPFGRGQIIWRDPESGVLVGGTESRTDGHIAVW